MLPYRAKNPPENFPFVTIVLMVSYILVFALTCDGTLMVRDDILGRWGLSHETMPLQPIRLLTSLFLNGTLFQLAVSLLFLWLFGAGAEGRLRPFLYLLVYLTSGIAGGLVHDYLLGWLQPNHFGLSPTAAIMGVAGTYIYMFPYARIRVWVGFGWMRHLSDDGTAASEWQPHWIVLYYAVADFVVGFLPRTDSVAGGWAQIFHWIGLPIGLGLAWALRARQDSEEASEAQAERTNVGGDFSILSLYDLEALMKREPDNVEVILAYCRKGLTTTTGNYFNQVREVFQKNANLLLEKGEPELVARMALTLAPEPGMLSLPLLLRVGGKLEALGDYDLAEQCYRRVYQHDNRGLSGETALIRLARVTEQSHPDKSDAVAIYKELLRRFPQSTQAGYARDSLLRLGAGNLAVAALEPEKPVEEEAPAQELVPSIPVIPESAERSGLRPIGD